MKLYLELNEPGSGSIKLHASDKLYNSVTINQFIEFFYRGEHRGGFLAERIRETIVGAGEAAEKIKEISGRGPLALLDDAIVWDWQTDDKEQIRHFTNMPKAAMLYNLLTESQTIVGRNCYPELTWDFTETHDSNGLEWTDSESLDFRVGTSLLDVLRQIASLGIDFSITMDTNQISQTYGKFILHAYRDGLGTNRADTVIFRQGKNCTELSTELVGGDIRNAILGSFPDKTYPWVYSQDATSQNLYRRREGFLTIQSSSATAAQHISDAELARLKNPQISVALKVSDAEGYKVFIDYNLGDIVSYEDNSGTLHPYRIVAMELSWEENTYADIILTLNSVIERVDFRVAKESIRNAGSSLGSVLRSPLAGTSGGTSLYLHETDPLAHNGLPVPEAEDDFQIATLVGGILKWVRKSLADTISILSSGTPTPNAIPRADANGKLDSWVTPSSGPSFTEGSIPFASANGELTEDNSHLFWATTDSRLIIGNNTVPPGMESKVAVVEDGYPAGFSGVSYGSVSFHAGWSAGGSQVAPTAIESDSGLFWLKGIGYDGTIWDTGGIAKFNSSQAWTSGGHGTKFIVSLIADDTTTPFVDALEVQTGMAIFSGAIKTNKILAPSNSLAILPSSDATDAIQLQNAAGTPILTVNTTNNLVGIRTMGPELPLHVVGLEHIANFDSTYSGGGGAGVFIRQTGASAPANHHRLIFFGFQETGGSILNTAWLGATTESAAGAGSVPTALTFWTGNTSNPSEKMRITSAGNVGIGTTTPGGGSTVGTKVVSIANGTAPVGGVANQVSLYSRDVGNIAELWGMDEAGNAVQLTPHPSEFLDALPIEEREYPWAYSAENKYLGKKIHVDMMGAIRAIERLSGERFIYIEDIPEQDRLDWDTEQENQRILKQKEIETAEQTKTNLRKMIENLQTKISSEESDKEVLGEEITYLERELNDLVIPEPYIPKPPPHWMVKLGVKTKLVQTTKT